MLSVLSSLLTGIYSDSKLSLLKSSLLPKSQITTLEEKTENLIRDTRNYDHIENYQREQRWLKNIQG